MAKIAGPLMSQSASGSVAGNITFSDRRSGQQARWQKKQEDRITANRTAQRALYAAAVAAWNELSEADQDNYKSEASGLLMTGYNFFIQGILNGTIATEAAGIFGVGKFGVAIYGAST